MKKHLLTKIIAFTTLVLQSSLDPSIIMPNKLSSHTTERDILPGWVKPTHYDLVIRPDLKKFEFSGTAIIK